MQISKFKILININFGFTKIVRNGSVVFYQMIFVDSTLIIININGDKEINIFCAKFKKLG